MTVNTLTVSVKLALHGVCANSTETDTHSAGNASKCTEHVVYHFGKSLFVGLCLRLKMRVVEGEVYRSLSKSARAFRRCRSSKSVLWRKMHAQAALLVLAAGERLSHRKRSIATSPRSSSRMRDCARRKLEPCRLLLDCMSDV